MRSFIMNTLTVISLGLLSGCTSSGTRISLPVAETTRPPIKLFVERATVTPTTGRPIAPIVAAAREAGNRCEFFDSQSKTVEELPVNSAGSVSIYLPDSAGQDNYAFNAEGVVVRHQRSYGVDFTEGVWRDAD